MGERRVVVTGMGAITPLGTSVAALWDGLISGRSGIRQIERFSAAAYDDPRAAKRMDRYAQLALASAKLACADARLKDRFDPRRAGVILGTGIGGIAELEEQHLRLLQKGPSKVSAFTIPKLMANAGSGHISIELNLQGINTAVATACASAGNAMGDAWNAVRHSEADVVITGGAEAAVTPLGIAGFAAMRALSQRNGEPGRASRPFDRDRDGFVLSEGAGILIFEGYEHAQARGAPMLAEVIGFGATADASDLVQPDPSGGGAARAMAAALAAAHLNPEDVDYVNAHGTSTPLGDIAETRALKTVFGPAVRRLAISSTKSSIGHLLGASGGVEAIATILALRHNTLPPTINLENPDPECDLDYVPNTARDANVHTAMSNSFGFGGHNACVVFRKL
jgi:3-oxoacyl-[acyl-carrier-protein] synthase II